MVEKLRGTLTPAVSLSGTVQRRGGMSGEVLRAAKGDPGGYYEPSVQRNVLLFKPSSAGMPELPDYPLMVDTTVGLSNAEIEMLLGGV